MRLSSQLCLDQHGGQVRRGARFRRTVGDEADFVFGPDAGVDARGFWVMVSFPMRVLDRREGVQGERTVLVGLLGGFGLAFEGGEFERDGEVEVEVGAEEEGVAVREVYGGGGFFGERMDCCEGVAAVLSSVAFLRVDAC